MNSLRKIKLSISFLLTLALLITSLVGVKAVNIDISKRTYNVTLHKFDVTSSTGSMVSPVNNEGFTYNNLETLKSELKSKLSTDKAEPIEGVVFEAYKLKNVDKLEELRNLVKMGTINALMTKDEAKKAIEDSMKGIQLDFESPITFDETNREGKSTKMGMDEGEYLVLETKKPQNYEGSVAVPFILELGAYETKQDVNIIPKNIITPKALVNKKVNDKMEASVSLGEKFTYNIDIDLRQDASQGKGIRVVDKLSNSLIFKNDVVVKTGNDKSSATELEKTDYNVYLEDEYKAWDDLESKSPILAVNTDPGKTLIIDLTELGIKKVNSGKLYVDFSAVINKNSFTEGVDIENRATVEYKNKVGGKIGDKPPKPTAPGGNPPVGGTPPDNVPPLNPDNPDDPIPPYNETPPKVWTGGKVFKKIEKGNTSKGLKDAVFAVKVKKDGEFVDIDKTEDLVSVNNDYVEFKKVKESDKTETMLVKSDNNGEIVIKGLKEGEYQLTEIKAPEGYAINTSAIDFKITKKSHKKPVVVDITTVNSDENTQNYFIENLKHIIPQTGGIGLLIFILIGGGLVAFALFRHRKYNK